MVYIVVGYTEYLKTLDSMLENWQKERTTARYFQCCQNLPISSLDLEKNKEIIDNIPALELHLLFILINSKLTHGEQNA